MNLQGQGSCNGEEHYHLGALQGSLCWGWLQAPSPANLGQCGGRGRVATLLASESHDPCPATSSHLTTALIMVGLSLQASRAPLSDKSPKEFLNSSEVCQACASSRYWSLCG